MSSFVSLSYLLPELWSLKCHKWHILLFCSDVSEKSVSLGKISWVRLKDLDLAFSKYVIDHLIPLIFAPHLLSRTWSARK